MPRKVSSSRPKSPELAPIARRIHSRILHHRSQAPASGLCLEARAANQPDAQPIAHARTRLDGSFRIEFTGAYLEEWLGGQRSISLRVLAGTTEIETTTEVICDLDSDVLDLTIEVEVERHDLPLPPHPTPPTPVPQPAIAPGRGDYGRNRWSASGPVATGAAGWIPGNRRHLACALVSGHQRNGPDQRSRRLHDELARAQRRRRCQC